MTTKEKIDAAFEEWWGKFILLPPGTHYGTAKAAWSTAWITAITPEPTTPKREFGPHSFARGGWLRCSFWDKHCRWAITEINVDGIRIGFDNHITYAALNAGTEKDWLWSQDGKTWEELKP
jgi:hypothetical protein